jgi:ferredoxin
MKIRVDRDLCESMGVCEQIAPAVFQIDEDDVLQVFGDSLHAPMDEDAVDKAIRRCPRGALSRED